MKTICYYAVASHLGGGERSLLELVNGVRAARSRGYEPWVLVPQEGPLVERLRKDGIRYEILPFPREFMKMSRGNPLRALQQGLMALPGLVSYQSALRETIEREKPALIHTSSLKCHLLAAWVKVMGDVPVLWHLRDIFGTGLIHFALKTMAGFASVQMVANSRATADAFDTSAGIPVIHNGLDPAAFFPKRNRLFSEELGISRDVPIVGMVGILARWKGQLEFLRMAAALIQQGVRARFVVAGGEIYDTVSDEGYGAELKREARRLGIEEHVFFAGFRSDPAEVMNGLDVVVHASLKPEPFGRVVVEGMACGTPVVAAGDGGILEIITDHQSGLLFPPGDVTAMAERVKEMLSFAELREKLAEEGRKAFLERFTRQHYVDGVLDLYDSMLR